MLLLKNMIIMAIIIHHKFIAMFSFTKAGSVKYLHSLRFVRSATLSMLICLSRVLKLEPNRC